MYTFRKILITVATLCLLFVTACSDDPASSGEGERPEVPDTTPAEVDNSYFENNSPPATEEFSGFNNASSHAQTANVALANNTALGESYLMFTQFDDAEFQNGMWVWTFSIEEDGEMLTIRTTAEEVSGGIEWKIYFSGVFDDEVVDEFLFVSGFVSNDGNSGGWSYYFPNDDGISVKFLEYEWSMQGEDNVTLSYTIFDEDGNVAGNVEYVQNGPEHTITMENFGFNDFVEVFWNTDTGVGYVIEDGEQTCWNQNFENVAC